MKNKLIVSHRETRKLSPLVGQYLQASLSENTRRAYSNDIQHFLDWGGRIPATPESVASYVAIHAERLALATLTRRVVAIGKAHVVKRLASPTNSELVKATLRGMRRMYGSVQRRVKPTLLNDIQQMVMGLSGMKGARDKAMLLIGFAGAFRRSELVSLQVGDVQFVEEGLLIQLRRSKTDQTGLGREIAIPYVRGKCCPVKATKDWMKQSEIKSGSLFRRVDRYGHVMKHGLTAQSVALIVKQRAAAIGLDAQEYSGHSLRAGLVTSAVTCGVSAWKICQQTGHQSESMMRRYIRDGHLFSNNPVGKIW